MWRSIIALVGFGVVMSIAAPARAAETLFRARVNVGAVLEVIDVETAPLDDIVLR